MLDELRASGSDFPLGLSEADDDLHQRLTTTFGITLSDCAALRNALDIERLDGVRIPKQSFLVVIVRNMLLHADMGLSSL